MVKSFLVVSAGIKQRKGKKKKKNTLSATVASFIGAGGIHNLTLVMTPILTCHKLHSKRFV